MDRGVRKGRRRLRKEKKEAKHDKKRKERKVIICPICPIKITCNTLFPFLTSFTSISSSAQHLFFTSSLPLPVFLSLSLLPFSFFFILMLFFLTYISQSSHIFPFSSLYVTFLIMFSSFYSTFSCN